MVQPPPLPPQLPITQQAPATPPPANLLKSFVDRAKEFADAYWPLRKDIHRTGRLRQAIIDKASAAAESLAIPEVRDFQSRQAAIQQEIAASHQHAEQLVRAKAEYRRLEQAVRLTQNESANAASELEHLHRPLGDAAIHAFLAGHIAEQPVFRERMRLNSTIADYRKEHDSLTPPPDAGMLDKTKAKAKQLAIMGKIKLEEVKIGGLDTQVGKQLVDSEREESVRCSGTESVLAHIANARANVAQTKQQAEQAAAALESQKATLCETFGLSQIEGARSLDAAISQTRQSIGTRQKELSALRSDLPGKLLAASDLPEG